MRTRRVLIILCICLLSAPYQGCQKTEPIEKPFFNLRLLATDPAGGGDAAISPDGKSFVISSKRSGNYDLWIYHIDTSEWVAVTNDPADDFEAQWSPDSRRLAFTSTRKGNKDIFVISLENGSEIQLTDSAEDDEYPAWSPDGKRIVYTGGPWKHRDFYLINAEGGTPQRLTSKSGKAGACSFSRDGRSVICHAYDSGSGDVFRLPVDGGDIVALTEGTAWDYKPTASPDDKWIAFSRSDESASAIHLMPAGGGEPRPLATTNSDDRWPTWSASSDRLFFHRMSEQGTAIKIFDRVKGEVRTVVESSERPLQASFNPQATRIVYCAEDGARRVLKIKNLESGSVQILNTGEGDAAFPRWSPDGKKIAFVSRENNRWEVCTINDDGTNLVCWTESADYLKGLYGVLDWSPDSTKLVFQGDTDPFESDLYMLDTTDGSIRNLTNDAWFDESPSWAADGKGVVFMSTRGGNWTWGLFKLSIEDGGVEVIARPDYTEKNFPRTSGKGWAVWSAYGEDGVERITERSPAGKIETLTKAGAGARWPSYSADGRYLLYTTINRQIEYWLAENLFSAGSPLLQTDHAKTARAQEKAFMHPRRDARPSEVRISPVGMHHR